MVRRTAVLRRGRPVPAIDDRLQRTFLFQEPQQFRTKTVECHGALRAWTPESVIPQADDINPPSAQRTSSPSRDVLQRIVVDRWDMAPTVRIEHQLHDHVNQRVQQT